MILSWLSALLVTQLVEGPIYAKALRGPDAPDRGWPATIALALGASMLTHPVVWFVIPPLIPEPWLAMVVVAELFAILAEAAYFRAFGLRRALLWSAFANASSVVVGEVMRALIDWP